MRDVGAAPLLVTTQEAPEAEVARVSDFVFNKLPHIGGRTAEVVGASEGKELRGVTIPLHPGAERYYREIGIPIPVEQTH